MSYRGQWVIIFCVLADDKEQHQLGMQVNNLSVLFASESELWVVYRK